MGKEAKLRRRALVRVAMLDGFTMEVNGTAVTETMNRSHKIWALLSYLILHRERPVSHS